MPLSKVKRRNKRRLENVRGRGAKAPRLFFCPQWKMPAAVISSVQRTHDHLAKSEDPAVAVQRDKGHLTGLTRLEPHGRTGRNIEPHAPCPLPFESQPGVGFKKMVVATHLDGPVSGVGNLERHGLASRIEFDVAGFGDDFAWDHVAVLNLR